MAAKKIQIKKQAAGEHRKKIVARHHEPIVQPPAAAPPRRKKPGMGALFVKLAVVAVILAGCAVFFVKVRREAVVRPRIEAIEKRERLNRIEVSVSTVEKCLELTAKAETEAKQLAAQAEKDVLLVLGEPIEKPAAPVRPPPRAKVNETTGAESEAPAVTPSEESDEPEPPAKAKQAAGSAPPGMLTREQLDARRRTEAKRREREKEQGASGAEPAPRKADVEEAGRQAPANAPPETANRPGLRPPAPDLETPMEGLPIRAAGRRLLGLRDTLAIKLELAQDIAARAKKKQNEAKASPHLYEIEEIEEELKTESDTAARLQEEASADLALAQRAAKRITALKEDFEKKKREAERLEAERRRAEEHRQRIALEKSWAEQDAEAAKALFRDFSFAEAVTRLKDGQERYQTDEGRTAHRETLDRYVYVQDLKAFLIDKMNAKPFSWGWGTPPSGRDVLGADEIRIKLRGAEAQWTDVDAEQMQKFVDHYADTSELTRRKLARMLMGSAVYFSLSGNELLAKEYSEKALSHDRELQSDADRLIK